jgi:hypothetical protein
MGTICTREYFRGTGLEVNTGSGDVCFNAATEVAGILKV